MKKIHRPAAISAIALAVAGAASIALAPAASAAITPGEYTFTTHSFGVPSSAPATVRGNMLILHSPVGPIAYPIHNTPGGGYIDSGQGQRYYINGQTFFGPFLIGDNTLTRR